MSTASASRGILIVNLGSPDSYETADVKTYLNEFLMDKRVIDVPLWLRKFLVQGIILNTRPKRSAKAYKKIWWEEGSPLIVISQRLTEKLAEKVSEPLELAMRYGNPSIAAGIAALVNKAPSIKEIFLIPLYPHYAMSSFETVVKKTEEVMQAQFPHLSLRVQEPFFDDETYIEVLSQSVQPYIDPEEADSHVLFSYHGVPERHLRKSDPTGCHCLKSANCCETPSEAHKFCYRHQVLQTSQLVAAKLGLPREKYTVSFQSRLGPDPWLKPYTTKTVGELAEKGVKKLMVICPAFVADCLETIEEIGMEERHHFLESGGEEFVMVPCLNDRDDWADVLAGFIRKTSVVTERTTS